MQPEHWLSVCCFGFGTLIVMPLGAEKPPQERGVREHPSSSGERREGRRDRSDEQGAAQQGDRQRDAESRREEQGHGGQRAGRAGSGGEQHAGGAGPRAGNQDPAIDRVQWARERRQKRAEAERARIEERFGPAKDNPRLRAELERHAWRMARLNRMRVLAKAENKEELLTRIETLISEERTRHRKVASHFVPTSPSAAPSGSARARPGILPAHSASRPMSSASRPMSPSSRPSRGAR